MAHSPIVRVCANFHSSRHGCVQADPMTKFRLEDATHQGLFLEDIKTLIKELQRWLDFTSVLT